MSVLERLNPRERVMVLGGGAVLLVLGVWTYIWQPLSTQRDVQMARIAQYLTVKQIAENAQDIAPVIAKSASAQVPLAPRITQSAENSGIVLARLDPDGSRLRVTVSKAGYDVLIGWIAALEATQNVRVVSVDMARQTEPGQVSLRMMLEDAG